jgi:hypothetical protein
VLRSLLIPDRKLQWLGTIEIENEDEDDDEDDLGRGAVGSGVPKAKIISQGFNPKRSLK